MYPSSRRLSCRDVPSASAAKTTKIYHGRFDGLGTTGAGGVALSGPGPPLQTGKAGDPAAWYDTEARLLGPSSVMTGRRSGTCMKVTPTALPASSPVVAR